MIRHPLFLALLVGGLFLAPGMSSALRDILDDESFRSLRLQIQSQYEKGQFQSALEGEKELVRMVEERYGPIHPLLAQVFGELGMMQRNLGQYAEAEKNLKWSLALQERSLATGDPRLADSLEKLSDLYQDLDRYQDALDLEKKVADIMEEKGNFSEKALARTRLGRVEMELGNFQAAESQLSDAVSILEKNHGQQSPEIIQPLQTRAEVGIKSRKWGDAQKDLERVFEVSQNRYTGNGVETADALKALGDFYLLKGDSGKSRSYYEQALGVYQKLLIGNEGYPALSKMEKTAVVLRGLGQAQEALDLDTKALKVETGIFGLGHPRIALCQGRIAWDEELLGKGSQAKADREAAKTLLKAALGDNHPLIQAIDEGR